MRLVGKLGSALLAGRFSDFLLTQQIESRVDPEGSEFAIWVRDEQRTDQARELFESFQATPDASQYLKASDTARQLRRDAKQRVLEIEKKKVTSV